MTASSDKRKWTKEEDKVLKGKSCYFQTMTTIKQWPAHVIESDGDYRNESFLEEYIGGPLYENQKYMKHLPIPDIDETIRRLLPTALSLAKTVEEKVQLIDACKTFPEEAQELQKRLIARKDGEFASSSWLQKWWNEVCCCCFMGNLIDVS